MNSTQCAGNDSANPLIYLFQKSWHYAAGYRKRLLFVWMMFILVESLDLFLNPMLWAKVLDTVQKNGVSESNLPTLIGLMSLTLVINFLFWCIHGPCRIVELTNAFKIRLAYRKHLLQGVMNLPMEWHSDHQSGETIDKVEKGTNALFSFSEESYSIIYAIVRFVGSYMMLIYIFPPSFVIVGVMCFVTLWVVMRFDNVLLTQYKELSWAENKISAGVFDSISNITTVIILRVEKLVFDAIIRKVEQPFELFKKNNRINEYKWFISSMCCSLTVVVVMSVYFLQHTGVAGGVLAGEVYLLYRYLGNISDLFLRFTNLYGQVVRRRAKVANAEELAEEFESTTLSNHVLPRTWDTLHIEGLTFSYESGETVVPNLNDISLSLMNGETVAFVGTSGSGKTTALKVMRALYKPSSLTLTVDGRHIADGFDGIARAIALVPQSPEIFASTIRENITLGADYDEDTIRHFTDMACFTEVVAGLPLGLESSINEKGVNLSGGQQQRLALSRGLLACQGKDIVLLDEPTSSLDAITERLIYTNIFAGFKGKTVVSSVHRLHLLPLFDRVCLFEGGQIVASGTFDTLLETNPAFQELWQHYSKEAV